MGGDARAGRDGTEVDGTGPEVTVPGEAPRTARAAGGTTLGVEEEFMLLDPSAGAAVLAGPDLARMLGGEPGVQQELMRFQVETATRVCTSLDDLGRELARLRRLVAGAAASLGCRLSGVRDRAVPRARAGRHHGPAPVPGTGPALRSAGGRGRQHLRLPRARRGSLPRPRRPGAGAAAALACLAARHHRQLTDRGRPRHGLGEPWRYLAWSRWPTAAPPAVWPDAAAYDATVRGLIERGAAVDEQGIYFLARLSPRYPTVEVRVADACLDAGITVLLAGLSRALVATALAEARRGTPLPAVPTRWVNAALAAAARRGLAGPGVDPFTGQAADARSLRSRLLDHVYPALSDLGDAQIITGLLHRLDDRGTGADRQRALFASAGSAPSFVEALARATLSGDEPARGGQPNAKSERPPPAGTPGPAPVVPLPRTP